MLHRILIFTFALFVFGTLAASAQQSAPKQPPTEPVERTTEDILAIQQLESEGTREAAMMEPRAVSHVAFPLTINVGITPYIHCSDWTANDRPITEVITMDLRDYVKNVLPNEWVNTWPGESLRAGAVAVKMFAWWRINQTETYPGVFRPEGVHVVDNTCDQVFWPNSHKPTTNLAVDQTWPYRLHDLETVREIHYLARDWQCEDTFNRLGGGWFRCLPQWTTKDMAEQGYSWQSMIYQYYDPISISVTSDIPIKVNVIKNNKFSEGLDYWKVSGGAQGVSVVDGVFRFHRGVGTENAAVLRQDINTIVSAGSLLKFKVMLGNDSAVEKEVRVRVMNGDGSQTGGDCAFILPPNSPLLKHLIWAVTPSAWVGVRIEIRGLSADSQPAYLVDKTQLKYKPDSDNAIPCEPPVPKKPVITAPAQGLTYGLDLIVAMTEGEGNYRPSYDAAFHIQIADNSDFVGPFFDNGADMADEPSIPVSLPSGTWYVRARQFDGIDRYSQWTAAVKFKTTALPTTPTAITPAGDVPADGQSFIWTATSQTNSYKLKVKDAAGLSVLKTAYTPVEADCASTCAVPLASTTVTWLTDVPYSWKVIAINDTGKVKSTSATFTLIPAQRIDGFRASGQ